MGALHTVDYELNDDDLKAHALEISALRTEILDKALAIDSPNAEAESSAALAEAATTTPLQRKYTRKRQGVTRPVAADYVHQDRPTGNYKKRKFHELTHLERVSIVHDVVVNYESHLDTARKFRVSKATVNRIICKLKKNKDYLKEVQMKAAIKEARAEKIQEMAQIMLDRDQNIVKAE